MHNQIINNIHITFIINQFIPIIAIHHPHHLVIHSHFIFHNFSLSLSLAFGILNYGHQL